MAMTTTDEPECPFLKGTGHLMGYCPHCGYDRSDPGNQWAQKPLSVRLTQFKNQGFNLGEHQTRMLDNMILSAEFLEEKLAKLEGRK